MKWKRFDAETFDVPSETVLLLWIKTPSNPSGYIVTAYPLYHGAYRPLYLVWKDMNHIDLDELQSVEVTHYCGVWDCAVPEGECSGE